MSKKRRTCRLCRKSYGRRTHKHSQTMCSIVCYRAYKVEQAFLNEGCLQDLRQQFEDYRGSIVWDGLDSVGLTGPIQGTRYDLVYTDEIDTFKPA